MQTQGAGIADDSESEDGQEERKDDRNPRFVQNPKALEHTLQVKKRK